MSTTNKPHYKRVVLKISGEGFSTPGALGIDPDELNTIARQIADAAKLGQANGTERRPGLPARDSWPAHRENHN